MRVIVQSEMTFLATQIAARVNARLAGGVKVERRSVEYSQVCCGMAVDLSVLADLHFRLLPIELQIVRSADLPADEVRIMFGGDLDLGAWAIMLHGDADRVCVLARSLRGVGFPQVRVSRCAEVSRDTMMFGGAPAMVRQIVAWSLHPHGFCPVQKVEWPASDSGIWLFARA